MQNADSSVHYLTHFLLFSHNLPLSSVVLCMFHVTSMQRTRDKKCTRKYAFDYVAFPPSVFVIREQKNYSSQPCVIPVLHGLGEIILHDPCNQSCLSYVHYERYYVC